MSDEDGRLRAKRRELERLERDLAEARLRGDPDEIAALEHELADLEVRGVEGIPIGDVIGAMAGRQPRMTGRWSWRWALFLLGLAGAALLLVWLSSGEIRGIGMTAIALLLIVAAITKDRSDRRRDRS